MNFPAPSLLAVAFITRSSATTRGQLQDLTGTGEPDITGSHMFMRRALYAILLMALLTIPAALTAGTAAASSSPARIAITGQYPGATASVIGQSQCAKPLAERSGNWLCPARPIPGSTASPDEGYCKIRGCWYVYSEVASGYSATGYFGYGDTQLGEVQLYFEVELNGAESRSKPVRFESSAAVVNLIFEGNRLSYAPKYPAGIPVGGAGNSHLAGDIPAGETVQWTPNGYKAYYDKASEQSVWHEWSWNMADYPGTWYFWRRALSSTASARQPTISATTTISARTRREADIAMGEQLLGSPRPGHGKVFVVRDRRGDWWASWQDNYPDDEVGDGEPDAGVEDFEGTEEEVLRWARSRPAEEFFIFSPEAGDYISLEPADAAELPARRSTVSVLNRPSRSACQPYSCAFPRRRTPSARAVPGSRTAAPP